MKEQPDWAILHKLGMYSKAENVCVKRFGENNQILKRFIDNYSYILHFLTHAIIGSYYW